MPTAEAQLASGAGPSRSWPTWSARGARCREPQAERRRSTRMARGRCAALTTRGRSLPRRRRRGRAVRRRSSASATCCGSACCSLALPLLAAVVVARTRYRLSLRATPRPGRGPQVGARPACTLRLENVSRLPTGLLLLEDRVPYALGTRPRFVLDRLEPRGVRESPTRSAPTLRGRYPLGPLAVRLTDPFGLCELTAVLHRAATRSS